MANANKAIIDMADRLRGNEWFKIRDRVLDRDGRECVNCGAESNLTVHHIVPISDRGTNWMSNLVTLCRKCHRSAHNHRSRDSTSATRSVNRSIFTVEELATILRSVTHPLHIAVILMIAKTGIGVGELCNLNISDIDLGSEHTELETKLAGPGVRIRYGGELPYNNRRERRQTTFVPIDGELERALKRWLAIRPDHPGNESLFAKTREGWGTRIDPSTVRYIFEKVGKEHGLYSRDSEMENFTPVALRYFFAERFRGQPKHRAYILGGKTESAIDFSSLGRDYRKSIFEFVSGSPGA